MQNIREKIFFILEADKYLIFYKILNYPIPVNFESFLWGKKADNFFYDKNFYAKKDYRLDDFIKTTCKQLKFMQHLPFVREIYLVNSLTFNKLNDNSDIDLFFVCKKNSLRKCRFFSVLYFWLIGKKKNSKSSYKKFCLSFYVTQDYLNIENLALKPYDPYLIYWIAHIIPIYKNKNLKKSFLDENIWIKKYLPNYSKRNNFELQKFLIPNCEIQNYSFIKLILEFIFFLPIREKIIKNIRYPIVIKKRNKLKEEKKRIIVEKNILKFHKDIRKTILQKFQKYLKNNTISL